MPCLDMFGGQNGAARSNLADHRQCPVLGVSLRKANAARSTGEQLDRALARQCTQVVFGGICGTEPEAFGDFRPRRRQTRHAETVFD